MRLLIALFLLLALVRIYTGYESRRRLPAYTQILPQLKSEQPSQEEVSEKPYKFNYYNKDYVIYPKADYQITGLVVSHNNIHSIADIYHDKSSVDIKDLCIIWGDNLTSDFFHKIKFWSGAWTCNIEVKDRDIYRKFQKDQISNNHILAKSEKVREQVRNIRVGDQVYLSGQLIDYHPAEQANQLRRTSMQRDDVGNGACEVLMLDYVKVFRQGNVKLNKLKQVSSWSLILLIIIIPIKFLHSAYKI